MKNFHLADSNEVMAVKLISASKRKNVGFPLSRQDAPRVHEIFSPLRFERGNGCWTPDLKNVRFPLSRHDVRRVHEKLSSRRFEQDNGD